MQITAPDIEMPHFQQYYPSVDSMDSSQRKYYDYWRAELTAGRPRTADRSYIFVHIYEILAQGVSNAKNLQNSLSELRVIRILYGGQVGSHVDSWIVDLLSQYKNYKEAYEQKVKDPHARNGTHSLNQLLNLKHQLNYGLEPEDIIPIAKAAGYYPSSLVRSHTEEVSKLIEVELNDFHAKSPEAFLSLAIQQSHLQIVQRSLFSGVPSINAQVNEIDFLSSSFLLQFAIDIAVRVEKILRGKYGRKKSPKEFNPLTNQVRQKLWEVKIHEPFENPSPAEKDCPHKYLKLVNHWTTFRQYICCHCEQVFMCESDRRLAEGVRPYQVKGEWLEGICPMCRNLDDTSFITPGKLMYGSTFYAKHWREIDFERAELALRGRTRDELGATQRNDAENAIRERYGVPLIGEGWVSETTLYKTLKDLFSDLEVIHHGQPAWLGRQHLDVYIPALDIAFEYQGRQHQEPVEYFGGKEAYEATKQRDEIKAKLCKENGVKLFYIYEGEDFSEETLKGLLARYLKGA